VVSHAREGMEAGRRMAVGVNAVLDLLTEIKFNIRGISVEKLSLSNWRRLVTAD
jgi:hypothetical protein